MSPASNSRFQSLVQMWSWNHCASSSLGNSLRNRYIGFQSTNTPPRSKTGTRVSVMGRNPAKGELRLSHAVPSGTSVAEINAGAEARQIEALAVEIDRPRDHGVEYRCIGVPGFRGDEIAGIAGDLVHLRTGWQRLIAGLGGATGSAGGAAPDHGGGAGVRHPDQANHLLQIGSRIGGEYALGCLEIVIDIAFGNHIVRLRNKIANGT